MNIRRAVDADWPRIWPIFDATVQAGETYAYPMDLTVETGRGLWMEEPPSETVVLEEVIVGSELAILGTAKMGPNRPGHGDHIGTASFMVAPEARGRGVGRALGEYVVQWHRDHGFHGIQFNAVVETNTAAIRLWLGLGFEIVGTVPEAFRSPAHGLVGLHVMYLGLGSGSG
jgi:GNAT superfamily N-acetyltransferase